jgi:hypothetical protein
MKRAIAGLAMGALLLLVAFDAAALSITVALEGVGSQTLTDQSPGDPLGCSPPGSTVDCSGTNLVGGPNWTLNDWSISTDADPFVIFDFSVTNTSESTQNFTITIEEFTSFAGPTGTGGSVQGGLTADSTAGTLGHNGAQDPMYQALIDDVVHQALFGFDSSVSAFAFGSASLGVADFGLPGLTVPGPGVSTSIAVELSFSLTPGDRASYTGSFVVEALPEPGSALLLGFGLVVALRAGRRSA